MSITAEPIGLNFFVATNVILVKKIKKKNPQNIEVIDK